jgi:cytochrome c nitrite reductase small subunit
VDDPPSTRRRGRIRFLHLALALSMLGGALLGLGSFTFLYGEGISYFSTDPTACVNCHIMQPQYDSWQKASHHTVARCVDCHLPHEIGPKLVAKSDNGYRHSMAFTFQDFHEPIRITERNARILQDNCIACHDEVVHPLIAGSTSLEDAVKCVHCHADVGHGPRAGLGR